ncbi:hypothetical protein GF351_04950 [Candidatus Woesearchaeota archaeon]|nr:hypothetical protein [Candidatus Woesearchaeota archaeon]
MEESVSQQADSSHRGDDQEKIQITYEVLYEFLRIEKNNEELQKLNEEFFLNTVNYLSEKNSILTNQQTQQSLFSEDEKENTAVQVKNIKKILQELYDRREKKIIDMAVNKSRIRSNIVDTSALLEEEKQLFDRLVSTLETFRQGILDNLVSAKVPKIKLPSSPGQDESKGADSGGQESGPSPLQLTSKLVRFIKPVPKFVGKELEQYGPFEEEDIANLPADIADLLIQKQKAEEMKG